MDTYLTTSQWQHEKVRFTVAADDEVLASAEVGWQDQPIQLEVPLENVKKMVLTSSITGGAGWRHASAAWISPLLQRVSF